MTQITEQQFLDTIKTKINRYLYRSLECKFDPFVAFLQETSLLGPMNWQTPANKLRMKNVFVALGDAANNYSLTDGDFRTYMLLKSVEVVYNEFSAELFKAFVESGYNVKLDSVVGNLDNAYSVTPPQNTQFPGLAMNTNPMDPLPAELVPNILYLNND
ncbi:MAG: hypothetical protein JHC33_12230 [Ignisphaera sp.]|nr:hypothetical protein [Ignisphaera sp.]